MATPAKVLALVPPDAVWLSLVSPKRLPNYPDLPTINETVPGFATQGWLALMAPAGTDPKIIQKINADLKTVLAEKEVAETIGIAIAMSGGPGTVQGITSLPQLVLLSYGILPGEVTNKPVAPLDGIAELKKGTLDAVIAMGFEANAYAATALAQGEHLLEFGGDAIERLRRLDDLASEHQASLPQSVRAMLRAFGVSGQGKAMSGSALVSYLLFEPSFIGELIHLGMSDTLAKRAEVQRFFGWPARAPLSVLRS